MPMYEYECQSCGNRIEALQSFNDPPLEDCDCGEQGTLKKLISAPAFQFKGSGWYVTDYADKGKKAKSEGGKDAGEVKSDGGKSDGDKGAKAKSSEASSSTGSNSKSSSSTGSSSGGKVA